mgnify:CR=1 FL=1|jgi:FkbM family methyltransferase
MCGSFNVGDTVDRYSELWQREYMWPKCDIHLWNNCNKEKNGPAMLDHIMSHHDVISKGYGTILQAGGAVGVYTDYYAKFFDTVVTYEPDKQNYTCLQANTSVRSNCNIRMRNMCLSDIPDIMLPMRNDYINVGATKVLDGSMNDVATYWAKTTTIDSEPEDVFKNLHIIHLDVEGHEKNILQGGKDTIQKHKPLIVLETWDDEYMDSIGYKEAGFAGWDKIFNAKY